MAGHPSKMALSEKIRRHAPLSQPAFEAMRLLPIPLQLEFLRRYYGVSQTELAAHLSIKQGYLSRLEKEGTDHLLSQYERIARALQARIGLCPKMVPTEPSVRE